MGCRVALCVPAELEEELAAGAARHGHEVVVRSAVADELATRLADDRVDIAVVESSPRHLSASLLLEADARGVRLVALARAHLERQHAAALGLFECIETTSDWADVERCLGALPEPARPEPAPDRGAVVAVWGPAGAPGRTTVAVTIAAELAAAGHSVALADVDTHAASIAPVLGLLDESPGFAAACRLAGADALTLAELERIGERCEARSGAFRVLTGISRPSRWPELSAERVSTVIRACREWVDYTVLDCGSSLEHDEEIASDLLGPRRNAATLAALRDADHVIAVGAADPVGLSRLLRARVELLESVSTHRVTVVVNKVRASVLGMGPHGQITRTLERFGGIVAPVLVPNDPGGADAALLTATPLTDAAPRSPARLAIAELVADRIAPTPEPRRRRRSPRGRLTPALTG